MDPRTFDRLVIAASIRPSRRATLRLLGMGLFGGLLGNRASSAAQRSDRDGDGLFDDDETDVYGTNPDVYDTDGDGSGDGEEVYYGTDPLAGAAPAPAVCGAIGADCSNGEACCIGLSCCFTAVVQRSLCTDLYATGGICPDFPCAAGTRRCGGEYHCRPFTEACPFG